MENVFNKHSILHDCQFGLGDGSPQSMALQCLIENITISLEAHRDASGVFMDNKKAFDTIDRNISPKNKPL